MSNTASLMRQGISKRGITNRSEWYFLVKLVKRYNFASVGITLQSRQENGCQKYLLFNVEADPSSGKLISNHRYQMRQTNMRSQSQAVNLTYMLRAKTVCGADDRQMMYLFFSLSSSGNSSGSRLII